MSTLLELSKRWAESQSGNDAKAEAPLIHADFKAVGPRGFVLDRAQWLGRYEGGLHNESFELSEVSERQIGDCGLLIGVQKQTSSYQGRPSVGQFRVTQVWLKQDETWQMASIQLSEIAQPG